MAFAGTNGVDPWRPDLTDPQLTVESNAGNNVLGLGDNGGPIIFETTLRGETADVFTAFTIDVVPTSATPNVVTVYFQTLTGAFDAFDDFTFDASVAGTLNLTSLIPSGTVGIILPTAAQYDNVSLSVVTVPETGALPLALVGLSALAGVRIVRRRK